MNQYYIQRTRNRLAWLILLLVLAGAGLILSTPARADIINDPTTVTCVTQDGSRVDVQQICSGVASSICSLACPACPSVTIIPEVVRCKRIKRSASGEAIRGRGCTLRTDILTKRP